MISLCPACKTEQMVTAIALQENRGVVCCEACAEDFKPRAHRVTPSRERAFKQRLKDLQLAMQAAPEEIVISPLNCPSAELNAAGMDDILGANPGEGPGEALGNDLGNDSGEHPSKQVDERIGDGPGDGPGVDSGVVGRERGDSDSESTRRLIVELGQSVMTLNKKISVHISEAADVIEQGKRLQNDESGTPTAQSNSKTIGAPPNTAQPKAVQRAGHAGPSIQPSLASNTSDTMRNSIKQQPAPIPDSGTPNQSQLSREGGQMKQATQTQTQTQTQTLSPEAIQRKRMRNERHAIARQKLLLEYEKLKIENEKLTVEKKKIELEKVKLEIMARQQLLEAKRVDPFASKGPALDGRPVVEYDIKTDLLPRTPNAINRGARQLATKSEKLHLELLPNEPNRLHRKNLASRSKSVKAK